jgi:hypothetical protein
MKDRLDANEKEERRDIDTRRWQATDNEGHLPGTNQSKFNEQKVREAEDNDNSKLNYLDDRGTVDGNE